MLQHRGQRGASRVTDEDDAHRLESLAQPGDRHADVGDGRPLPVVDAVVGIAGRRGTGAIGIAGAHQRDHEQLRLCGVCGKFLGDPEVREFAGPPVLTLPWIHTTITAGSSTPNRRISRQPESPPMRVT
ncbi:MAG: hypothetical protein IPI40_00180 [Betaproteobacteria bacterium]|nr:hypothetical protein [Betaproteobacteria bacterium]